MNLDLLVFAPQQFVLQIRPEAVWYRILPCRNLSLFKRLEFKKLQMRQKLVAFQEPITFS